MSCSIHVVLTTTPAASLQVSLWLSHSLLHHFCASAYFLCSTRLYSSWLSHSCTAVPLTSVWGMSL